MTSFIYPVVVSATWGGGWLASEGGPGAGYMDFAGSGTSDDLLASSGSTGRTPIAQGRSNVFLLEKMLFFFQVNMEIEGLHV
jgi:hypothetical protein